MSSIFLLGANALYLFLFVINASTRAYVMAVVGGIEHDRLFIKASACNRACVARDGASFRAHAGLMAWRGGAARASSCVVDAIFNFYAVFYGISSRFVGASTVARNVVMSSQYHGGARQHASAGMPS